jgi:alkanesulfonate monooxygenase SsuD/methylene tetrahydromethanopterin reductase-like flavin-dependent oxidoreductase (luciferase family)
MPGDFMAPAGYNSRVASKRILEQYKHSVRPDALYGGVDAAGWDKVVETNRVVVGSPKTVIKKIRQGLEVLRPGILGVWTNDGTISHKDTMRCLQLMKDDVIPELREMGKELGLPGPFEVAP